MRRITVSISSGVKQWRGLNRDVIKQRRGLSQWSSNRYRPPLHYKNKTRFSTNTLHDLPPEMGLTVDLANLLSSPERYFLIKSSNGQKVPVSSLKGKLVGLYFCENLFHPPHLEAIKKAYEEAKSRGYDFEIVQITLHYHSFKARDVGTDSTVSWLTVPFMDPSCRKIQEIIFQCIDDKNKHWYNDCLVLIYPHLAQAGNGDTNSTSGVIFEFSGAEILERWGIEGYPFTRQSLYEAEYELQRRQVTLQSLFPPEDGFDAASQLSGKTVLVLFAQHDDHVFDGDFISMLKTEYEAQVEESKFEVVYVITHSFPFDEFTKDMPWLVRPFSSGTISWHFKELLGNVFKEYPQGAVAVAFNEQGELIAKKDDLHEKREGRLKLGFPFIDPDLDKCIRGDVERLCPSLHCNKNRHLSTAVEQCNNRDLSTSVKQCRVKGLPFSKKGRYRVLEIGYTVDVAHLLFTPERDFLIKNNGQKVDDLWGKTILLFIVPLDDRSNHAMDDTWDVIDAYYELQRMGSDVEFVFVPVQLHSVVSVNERFSTQEALFNHLFSAMSFPAIPFSDVQGPEDPVVRTFSVDDDFIHYSKLPYWVVIDPTNIVVATRFFHSHLFKLFGGAELYPLSRETIKDVEVCYGRESRMEFISKWDQLLASDTRDFLLSSNGDKVPISSLKGKLIGLYFCENIPHPPRMKAIKKVYGEAKSRGYDFEIVQITFHYRPFGAKHVLSTDQTVRHCCEDVRWLRLPFKDPSCRKLQRILNLVDAYQHWVGDSLVLIYPHQADEEEEEDDDDVSEGLFELSGAEILERWGIEGYPFTRESLYKAEYEVIQREKRLQSLFPPGESLLRSTGDGFDLVDAFSQLSGKRVLVFFAPHDDEVGKVGNFLSMLKCEYEAQVEESKFEVVYVSTRSTESSFHEFTKDMPWLVLPFSSKRYGSYYPYAMAFNEQGELVAREYVRGGKKEGYELRFPFIDQDLEEQIRQDVEDMCYESDYDYDG